MTNPMRGDVEFKVGDIAFTTRPTFAFIVDLENTLKIPVLHLSAKVRTLSLSYTELVNFVLVAARHAVKPPANIDKEDAFREAVFQAGPTKWYAPMIALVTEVFRTGEPDQPEKKDDATTTSVA